jgi:hypothetical protein
MKRTRREKGQSATEFALILPVLLIVMAGLLDLGRLYYSYVAVTDAAGEGAAYAAIHPDDTDDIAARAQDATGGLIVIEEDLVEVYSPPDMPQAIAVSVSYEFTLVTPFVNVLLPDGLTLQAVAIELPLSSEL